MIQPSPVFISYARIDGEETARRLYADLLRNGIAAWIDKENIPTGADWDQAIDNGLSAARAVLVVLTPTAVLSDQVKSEWNRALTLHLPLIPLLAGKCTVPRVLAIFNYVDVTATHYEEGFARTLARLHELDANNDQRLRTLIEQFEVAQSEAPDPKRFQPKLDDLREALERWEHMAHDETRIERGVREQVEEFERRRDQRRLRTPSKVVGQPPQDVTTLFKDRTQYREEIGRLLAHPDTRLVTIVGRGGMGKTALATKVLRDIEQGNWPQTDESLDVDGIVYESTRTNGIRLERIFLDCAQMLGGERVDELGKMWASADLSSQDKIARLLNDLDADARYIVLLDNFDDLLGDDGTILDEGVRTFIEMNLTAGRGLRALLTTRLPPSLPLPLAALEHRIDLLEGLPVGEGVALLRQLDAHGMFGLRELPDAELAQAVTLLHGVPRALEVLVGIMANDPFVGLQDILPKFFEHGDTVRRIVEENYRRLDRSARQVMEALAVYDRPVPLVAVEYLLAPYTPGLDVAGIARRLTQSSIVSIERKTRLMALHPIDRDYAYGEIPRDGGEYTRGALERRAAEYFGRLAMPAGTWNTLDDLEPALWEFEHLIRAGDYDAAVRLLGSLDDDMREKGMSMRALTMHQQIEGHVSDRELLVLQVYGTAAAQGMLAKFDESLAGLEVALSLARDVGDKHTEARVLRARGAYLRMMGRLPEAIQSARDALALSRETNDVKTELQTLYAVSLNYAYVGRYTQAIAHARELVQLAEQQHDARMVGEANDTISACLTALRRYDEAKPIAEQAAMLLRQANLRDMLDYVLNTQGLIELGLGEIEAARRYLQEALAMARADGYARPEALILFNMAHSYRMQSNFDTALRYANESLARFSEIKSSDAPTATALVALIRAVQSGDQTAEASRLLDLARASATGVDFFSAAALAEEACALAQSLGDSTLVEAATTFSEQFYSSADAE